MFGTHKYKTVLQLDNRFVDWYYKLAENFSDVELHALTLFANEHAKELPDRLVEELNLKFEHIKTVKKYDDTQYIKEERVRTKNEKNNN